MKHDFKYICTNELCRKPILQSTFLWKPVISNQFPWQKEKQLLFTQGISLGSWEDCLRAAEMVVVAHAMLPVGFAKEDRGGRRIMN